ncbi:MAG: magnesium/cobalt transporter CorA [Ferruginibacter sp.]
MNSIKYLDYLFNPHHKHGRKKIVQVNPTVESERIEPDESIIYLYEYDHQNFISRQIKNVEDTFAHFDTPGITWINVEGLRKNDIEVICTHFGIHTLIMEDILHLGQRPKMDELNDLVFCTLNMLYYENYSGVEAEQVSIVLGKNFVITFQEDASRDVFNVLREKIKIDGSKIRQKGADFLFYSMIDTIVDDYYIVMEKLGGKMELLEDDIIRNAKKRSLAKINMLRKEMIVLRRSVLPVRDLVNGILKSDNELIDEQTEKYFKDVYDHSIQASEMADSYRDMMINLQDLYHNNVNLRTNEAMKVIAIVTSLMAPATVIGGIFGMNFDIIPFSKEPWGFYLPIFFMIFIPLIMIFIFKKRGWF